MSVTSPDFESGAYTNFATPAGVSRGKIINPMPEGSQPEEFYLPTTEMDRATRRFDHLGHPDLGKMRPGF